MTTKQTLARLEDSPAYEKFYKLTVLVKGFDGCVELVAGLWLIFSPGSLHGLLRAIFGETLEHPGRFAHFLGTQVAHIDADLTRAGLLLIALYLLVHAVVKIWLVYSLWNEILWAYPYAIAILLAFLGYQLWVFARHPTVGMFIFCVLDVIVMLMAYGEWQKLKRQKATR